MKNIKLKTIVGTAVLFLLLGFVASHAEVSLSFDHFYDNEELAKALKDLEKEYPGFMKVMSLGKTVQGRDIWGVIVNNPKTGPAEHKSGYYIDGNIHGNEIQGTEVALYAIYYLLKNYGKTELATRLLDERAFYLIPTMNPDGREYFINRESSYRTGLIPRDDDRDGEADEDPPDDLDGDGFITSMRKKDPEGRYKPHPKHPRIMIPAEPGEKGQYTLLGTEGIDNDGDGLINEDDLGGYDMNRNFGYAWQPEYVQMGSGPYPFCWPETIVCRDFLLAHPNILGAQSFHNYGGMILSPPGAPTLGKTNPVDKRVLDYVGEQGEKILPGYRYIIIHEDLYTVYGGTVDFTQSGLGIYTYSNELDIDPFESLPFGQDEDLSPEEMQQRQLENQLKEMFYHDYVMLGEAYSEWKPAKHPLYGDIEIGGITKFGRRVPSSFQMADTCHRNAAFIFYHADQLPRLSFAKVSAKKLESGMFQLDIRIENSRVTPTISNFAVQKKIHRTDKLKVAGNGADILAAGYLRDQYRGLTTPIKAHDDFIWIANGIPGFGQVTLRLLVKGQGNIELIYDSLKGGYYTTTAALK